ncbi:MAG: DNA alkylation repair protein, partial [Poseidonibacter sp.]|uniref:DNA alkylation repair protein n=1 Tax=Poseidonibacter sp. TaxID=2321188 RepID=UPI00359DEA08
MILEDILDELNKLSNPKKVIFKENKFGIISNNSLGIYHKDLKELAKRIGQNNQLALQLFDTEIYEARILCSKIYNPNDITEELMEKWVKTFENWEICDSFCMGFFAKSKYALQKTEEWSKTEDEFIKRASFTIMASYGFANKNTSNKIFERFLEIIEREVNDDRIYVRKAVNWALRNIGKRNIDLHRKAISSTNRILQNKNKSAQWIAKNALKELEL